MNKIELICSENFKNDTKAYELINNFIETAKILTLSVNKPQFENSIKIFLRDRSDGVTSLHLLHPDLNAGHALNLDLDFDKGLDYSRRTVSFKKEILAKALGVDQTSNEATAQVLDATVGVATDAIFLIKNKISVMGFEQNPLVYLILSKAHSCASEAIKTNFELRWGPVENLANSDFTQMTNPLFGLQAIYFDPMFPENRKTALPRQEMQILKFLNELYHPKSPEESFAFLRSLQKKLIGSEFFKYKKLRLVVKRNPEAKAFEDTKLVYQSKLLRYDVYEERI